jgi:hypothetical protein
MKIIKTPYYSYRIGTLPKGCQLCVKGSKLVLFITGLCPRHCYFCPIGDQKYKKDFTYADEWKVSNISQIIEEARLISAKGAGITGGDPLSKLWNTLFSIRKLKKRFGKKFHIHLYTSLDLINKDNLKKLHTAGLDEIRFHPDLDNEKLWGKTKIALEHNWDVGIEVPVIPKKEKQLIKLICFIDSINKSSKTKIKFLNLNELEIADNKHSRLGELGYKTKNNISYAIKGSEELGKKLLKFIKDNKIKLNIHYCTATLKDRIQMTNRLKHRARNIKKPFDIISKDTTLIRGAIYLDNTKPGMNYRKKLNKIIKNPKQKKIILKKLHQIRNQIKKDFKIPNHLIETDPQKLRILTSKKIIIQICNKINRNFLKNIPHDKNLMKQKELYLAIVEEYPTYDQLELSVEFL